MSSTWLFIGILFGIGIVVIGLVICLALAIRALVRHNARQKQRLTQQQEELDRMKIDDL